MAVLVSICCITYKHFQFITDAMEGFLMQKTNFDFEIVVGEDYSQDGTAELLVQYQKQHPGKVKLILNNENIGMMPNFINTLKACSGKYIAYCEGDDYWIDPLKLQKQVDCILENIGCSLVFTDLQVFSENEKAFYPNWASVVKKVYEFKDLVQANVISTCTILFVNPGPKALEEWLCRFRIGDYPLYLLLLRSGYAYFLNEITTVYREHSGGVFSLRHPLHNIDINISVLEIVEQKVMNQNERLLVRKSLLQWYYSKLVRMSEQTSSSSIRKFIREKIRLSDMYLNVVVFAKIMLLFGFPGLKAKAFTS